VVLTYHALTLFLEYFLMITPAEPTSKWDAPLTQAQWNACKWMFEPDRLATLLDDDREKPPACPTAPAMGGSAA
jgi:hypothetical protein